jgi:hypothetical protein
LTVAAFGLVTEPVAVNFGGVVPQAPALTTDGCIDAEAANPPAALVHSSL